MEKKNKESSWATERREEWMHQKCGLLGLKPLKGVFTVTWYEPYVTVLAFSKYVAVHRHRIIGKPGELPGELIDRAMELSPLMLKGDFR